MKRRLRVSLVGIVLVALGGVVAVQAAGWSPKLGLDLQGGVAVVLAPEGDFQSDAIDQSIDIVRSRVDALGVAEPEITRQGDNIVVQLPGVTDQRRAREIVGQTAELRFRPVLEVFPVGSTLDNLTSTTEPAGGESTTSTANGETSTTAPVADESTTSVDGASTTPGGDQSSLGRVHAVAAAGAAPVAMGQAEGDTTTTEPPPETTSTTSVNELLAGLVDAPPITDRADDVPENEVVLPQLDENGDEVFRFRLAPSEAEGEIVSTAHATLQSSWVVNVEFTGEGSSIFDDIAARNVGKQLAIVLDGVVMSAPTIQTTEFNGSAVISGSFTESDAKDLALVLRFGALPVQLVEQSVQEVTATLGHDALDAGLLAGLVGLSLVALYLIAYYRLLGLVAVVSLGVAGGLLWTIIAWLGESSGLALTLAGATGIIVSIGVAVDSNVVYYERIKEEVRSGRTPRSAAELAFSSSFSTIVKADTVGLIAAVLLYQLTVGPVRGFAFFLGLSTLLDLVVSYFFMRPAAILLARSPRWGTPSRLGIPERRADADTMAAEVVS